MAPRFNYIDLFYFGTKQ